jgi:hypothetical protein
VREDVRARARAGAWVAGTAGFLVMVVSGLRSGPYLPNWQDPDDGPPCSFSSSGCPDDLDAALRHLWWWTAVGGALLLLAVAAHTWCLPSGRVGGAAPRVPVAVRAACLGGGCLALSAGLGWGVVFALILTPHLLPPAIAVYWLVQAVVVSAVEQTSGAASPRRASVTGMVSAAVATGLTAWLFFDEP